MRKIIIFPTLILAYFFSAAQDFSNKGKEFWLAYCYHVGMVNSAGGAPAMTLYLTSDVATTYNVEIYGGVTISSGNINANQVIPVTIPNTYFISTNGLTTGRTVHVTAVKSIVVYSFITRSAASAATLALPVNVLGKEYYSSSYTQISNENSASSYITIIGVENNTSVEVTPTANTVGGWVAGTTYTININKGDVYQVLGTTTGNNGVDLSGTKIKSVAGTGGGCKKIAVFSGSGKLSISTTGCTQSSADNLYQQLYPSTTWGKRYLTAPSASRPFNYYRVYRPDPTTNVYVNNVLIPAGSFTNSYYQFYNNTPNLIDADKPVSVAQYFTTQGCPAGAGGNPSPYDPDMIMLNPVEQNIDKVTLVNSPLTATGTHIHNVHVIMKNSGSAISSFRFDGAVPAATWTVHPQDPSYSYLYLANVAAGNHTLRSDSGFNALAYGYGNAESYGYSAGANVKDLYQQIRVQSTYGIEEAPSVCTNSPFKFKVSLPYCVDSIKWNLTQLPGVNGTPVTNYTTCTPGLGGPDSTTIVNGKTIYWYSLPNTYTFATTGTFPVTLTTYFPTTECGGTQEIDFDLQISSPPVPSFTEVLPGCYAESIQFIETTPQTPKPTYSWTWDFGDGNFSNARSPVHTYAAPGTYNVTYSSITTPGCLSGNISHPVVIPDIPKATISKNTDTVCINTTTPPTIVFTGTDGTTPYEFTYTLNGVAQPPVTSNAAGTYTITVPVAAPGQFIYELTNVKNVGSTLCARAITNQKDTATVLATSLITLTSPVGTPTQTVCINTPIVNITYSVGGSANGGVVTGLPAGVTGTYAAGIVTITGTPTVSGTFNYTATTVGPCINVSATGIITVTDDGTIALTSGTGTNNQTLCINTPLVTNITYAVGGSGNGGTVTGLPAGITGTYAGGIITITGTPTVAGTFNYTVNTTGPCVKPSATGTIIVTADATLTLTSAPTTPNQTVCINNPFVNITYAVAGTGTGGSVTGLPTGVTGTYAGGVITITGTPTVAGIFTYTVNTTGPCDKPSATGTLTVTDNATISLTSGTGSDNQTICINTALSNITYAVGGSATGAVVTGLPAGITGTYAGGVFTISGSPSVSGVFNYTVSTQGPCVKPTISGTITVTADATLTLTTAPATTNQTVCINNAIAIIRYAVGGTGTGGSVTGLPTGITGTYAGGIITITGTPTATGVYNYTVNTTGPCAKPSATGSITVTGDATLTLTSAPTTTNQSLCLNTGLTNITYAVGGTGTGAVVTGLPAGVAGVYAGGVVTISGTATVSGTFNYTVTTQGPCVKPALTGSIIIWPLPIPNFTTNTPICETRDITFTDASNPQVGTLTNWSWNFGDPASGGLNTSTQTNPLHRFATAGNYTVSLTVNTSNGCSNAVPFTKTVVVNDRPKAGFIVPEVCINDNLTLFTDTSKIANGTISAVGYMWNYGDPGSGVNNTSTGMNGSHLYTAIGPYNVTHIVTSTLGCKDTATNTIFINAADPIANFSVPNATALCANDSVSIVNLSTISQGNVTKVEIYWDWVGAPTTVFTDDFPAPNKVYRHKYPNFQTPLTRNYTVRMVAYSGTLCFNTKNTVITVNAAPKVQFNNMAAVCYNSPAFTITQGSETGGVPGTFVYSGPGITNANGTFNAVAAGIGTHTIKYKFTSTIGGCADSATNTITVLDTASAKFSFSSPTCQGSPVTFKEESTAQAGVTLANTVFDFGDGSPLQNQPPGSTFTHLYANWGTYTVTMYNVSAYGCRSAVKQQQVYVSPIPNASFAFGQTSVCIPNADVSFTNNSTIADGTQNAFTYLWNFGDPASGALNTSVANTPPVHRYNGIGPYTVTLTVTSGNGCVNTISRSVDFIHPQPKTDFNFSKPTVCLGDNVVMTDVTNGLDGTITQWFWKFSDGGSGSTKQVAYVFGTPNTYSVSLYTVNSRGCNSDTLTKQFTVYGYPFVDAGPDKVVLEGGTLTLEPTVTGNLLQYLWTPSTYLNDPTIKNPVATNMLDDITYTLTVTGEGGCTAPPDKMFVKVLKTPKVPNTFTPNGDGINDVWKIDYLESYPNCKMQVFTRTGQLVFESKGYKTPWDGRYNGNPLPFDTYYYVLEPGSGRKPVTGYVTIVK